MKKREKYPKGRLIHGKKVYAGPPVGEDARRIKMIRQSDAEIVDVYGGPEMMGKLYDDPEQEPVDDPVKEPAEGSAEGAPEAPETESEPSPVSRMEKRKVRRYPDSSFDPRIAEAVYGGPGYVDPRTNSMPFGPANSGMMGFTPPPEYETDAQTKNAAHCKICGAIAKEGAKFCIECGSPLPKDEGETI